MSRRPPATILLFAVALVVGALAPAASPQATPPTIAPGPEGATPIVARASLAPRIVLFGDTVRAHVDVILDRRRIDPDSVRVAGAFAPWEVVGEPERTRRDAGSTTYLRTTYVLRCVIGPCVPSGQTAPRDFGVARVGYAEAGSGDGQAEVVRRTLRAEWPVLTVYSRFASASFDGREGLATPWRADVVSLPPVSYRVAPGLLLGLLLAGGALFAAGGVLLAYLARPRRAPAPPPEPEPPPAPALSPLEQALALLEDTMQTDGAEGRRRALELVAEALAEHGDADLAGWARVLAWSEGAPDVEETVGLAARVRATLELVEEADGGQDGVEEDGASRVG